MIIPRIKKTYQDQLVLDFPEMEIPDGSLIAIVGPNGSGKSTLGRILAAVIKADDDCPKISSERVGYMSQQAFAFRLSVKNNLLQNKDTALSKEENEARAEELMKTLRLSELAGKNAAKLSGGQKQRMSLARILMKDYKVLILDEPTASMDPEIIPVAEALILNYQKRTNCTILLITHSLEQAGRLSEKIIQLQNGKPAV